MNFGRFYIQMAKVSKIYHQQRVHCIRRAAYQANVWDQLPAIQELPELSQCGWTKIEGQWGPLWTTLPDVSETLQILASCGCNSCKSKNRNRCKCLKAGLNCTLLCKCGENCE